MKADRIDIHDLRIPFSRAIRHRLRTRRETEGVVVAIRDAGGSVGVGEGTPRVYVTGETLDGCLAATHTLCRQVIDREIDSRETLFALLARLGGDDLAVRHPAAWCAVETALLDLWARIEGRPLVWLFDREAAIGSLTFSGVMPYIEQEAAFERTLALVKRLDLSALKLKVVDRKSGIGQLERLRRALGEGIDLRVDANAAFTPPDAIAFLRAAAPMRLSAVEQPVAKEDLDGLKRVTDASPIPVIADESMYTARGPRYLIENRICHGLNIRLSSCGGIIKAVDLYRQARSRQMMVVLGAHVGETAILSFAGRHLAMLCPEAAHREGSFSTYVLQTDLVEGGTAFGLKGAVPVPTGPGLGVEIDPRTIEAWSVPVAVIQA